MAWGLVVVGRKHDLCAQRKRQLGNAIRCEAMLDDEPRHRLARQCAQIGVQLDQRFPDELDAPVRALQTVQDGAVKNKDAMHPGTTLQSRTECRVVVYAQVAAKP